MIHKKRAVFLALILLFSITAPAQKTKFAPVGDYKKKEAAIEQLEQNLPALMKAADIPGISIALIRGGKTVWTRGFGVKNSQTKEAVTTETVFEAASLTKPVFAYAVLKLVEAGKLDLDAPLNKYLPGNYDVAADDARIGQITARRILSHTSGFPNWRSPRNAVNLPIYFAPGERFSYSGEGFVYLSKVVERITGMKFDEYVRETVFKPLGMTKSTLAWEEKHERLKTFNHDLFGTPTDRGEGATANAAGSLQTTAADYAKFVAGILNGTGLKKETRRQMTMPQIRIDESCLICTTKPAEKLSTEIAWGLGWGLQTTGEGNSFWHWGDNGNNKSFIVAFEKQKDGIVIMTNSANGLSVLKEILSDGLGGKHPVLAWLNAGRYDSPARILLKAIVSAGAEQAIGDYRKRRAASPAERLDESRINSLGYDLLRAQKVDEAIALFTLNTEDFPASANTWDSLGEAYMIQGDFPRAIASYKKSLELNPDNKGAAERIKQMEQQ